ncbi:MAG TPA: hypothetical protein ENF89_02070, partial [Candidatus Bathyarchaeota archaeon]|nr:hypothetical protein [Candidatus Bathyarchaeota archaeon]
MNGMKKTLLVSSAVLLGVSVLLALAYLGVAPFSVKVGMYGSESSRHMEYRFWLFTGAVSAPILAGEGESLVFKMDAEVRGGYLIFEVVESDGAVLWRDHVRGSETIAAMLPLEEGLYWIRVRGMNARGSFKVSWLLVSGDVELGVPP